MQARDLRWLLWLLVVLTACGSPTPQTTPTSVPTETPTVTPTSTPSPTPTATPLPPFAVTIRSLDAVSAVAPTHVAVDLVPPPTEPAPDIVASVIDPTGATHGRFDLAHQGGGRYVAPAPLQLPLDPQPGDWRVVVGVATRRALLGDQTLTFTPAPIAYRPLTATLPSGVSLRVPEAFEEIAAQGNARAGYRRWTHAGAEIGLWWAPGPAEPHQRDTALMMLEAALGEAVSGVESFEETTWGERTAYAFTEEASAEGWVLQDDAYVLYVLRLHPPEGADVPGVVREVVQTFRFVAD